VHTSSRGTGTALELAFALRDLARSAGYAGIVAWVEPHEQEAALARLLRLRQTGPLLHRFEIPLSCGGGQDRSVGDSIPCLTNSGTIAFDGAGSQQAPPMLDDLLSVTEDRQHLGDAGPTDRRQPHYRRKTVHWVLDRHRLVLSGLPCQSVADLPKLIVAMRTVPAQSASALEVPVPAADLSAALSLVSIKARRLSRTPVRIGRLDFAAAPPHDKPVTAEPAVRLHREFVTTMTKRSGAT
jgi:hypothetical protein